MGGSVDGPYFHTISEEEALELKKAKTCIKNIFENANKNQLKGLDALLSVLSDLSKSDAPIIVDDEYLRGEMKNLDYKLKDVEDVAGNEKVYKNLHGTGTFGALLSAAINNVIKPGEKVYIKSPKPIDNLFYNLKDAEGHVDIAGNYLGQNAVNSRIFAREVGDYAGYKMKNSEINISGMAGSDLGRESRNSKINVYEAGNYLGISSTESKIMAKKAGNYAGLRIGASTLIIDEARDNFAQFARDSEIHFNEVGDKAAYEISRCSVYGKKAGECFGAGAFKSKMYIDELGDNPFYEARESEIHFKKINGKLGNVYSYHEYDDQPGTDIPICFGPFSSNNKIYKKGFAYLPYKIKAPIIKLGILISGPHLE